MLCESCKAPIYKTGAILLAVVAAGLIGTGTVAARVQQHAAHRPVVSAVWIGHPFHPLKTIERARSRAAAHARRVEARRERAARRQPHTRQPRATISHYEHTVARSSLRRQGCSAAQRGVGGIVILDFGQPAYNGHTYGTYLFSGRFAGNKAITRAMFAYAYGYHRCLAKGSRLRITLARGTSNYHPQVPSAYRAGRRWARETMALQHSLRLHGLHEHVLSAAADDVEPAWDRSFHRTRDFFRGYRDARTGHTIYNYGSLDGGVGSVWNARQVFFVTSGMRYAQAIPEIYNHAMAREWAELAHIARHRYHRPMRFAGVMTTHTSRNHGMKPRDAHKSLVRALATRVGSAAPDVPATLTNIVAAD
jgi:hypothetical protein